MSLPSGRSRSSRERLLGAVEYVADLGERHRRPGRACRGTATPDRGTGTRPSTARVRPSSEVDAARVAERFARLRQCMSRRRRASPSGRRARSRRPRASACTSDRRGWIARRDAARSASGRGCARGECVAALLHVDRPVATVSGRRQTNSSAGHCRSPLSAGPGSRRCTPPGPCGSWCRRTRTR